MISNSFAIRVWFWLFKLHLNVFKFIKFEFYYVHMITAIFTIWYFTIGKKLKSFESRLTLFWVDLILGWPHFGLTLFWVDLILGWPHFVLTSFWVDLILGWFKIFPQPETTMNPTNLHLPFEVWFSIFTDFKKAKFYTNKITLKNVEHRAWMEEWKAIKLFWMSLIWS